MDEREVSMLQEQFITENPNSVKLKDIQELQKKQFNTTSIYHN